MVDHTKATGTAGALIIRDDGVHVTLLLRCNDTSTFVSGASFSRTVNGSTASGALNWASGGGTRVLSGPWTVTTSQTVKLSISATGTQGLGGPTSLSVAISRALPAAPSALNVARVSDTQHTLTWTRNATYTSVVVQRRTDGGAWQQVGVPAGNAATFTDKTTTADHQYDYRVAGRIGSAQSAWSTTKTVYTSPAPPTHLIASRSGNNIVLNTRFVEDQSAYVDHYQVFDNGVLLADNVSIFLPWTHVDPDQFNPHTYTMKAVKGALVGPLSTPSNTVQLIAPPNAPTGLAPNGGVLPSDEDVLLRWTHNPVDSSPQLEFELRYREPEGEWTTVPGATESEHPLQLPVGDIEWQVRTKGLHPDWSPWSAVATFAVVDRPGVGIVQPADDWAASTLTVIWSWFQAQARPQSAWQLELLDASLVTVESRNGPGDTTSVTLAQRLTEGTWTVRVRAATGDLWSDWTSETFEVAFDPPVPPALTGEWDDMQGGVSLSVGLGLPAVAEVEDGVWFVDFER